MKMGSWLHVFHYFILYHSVLRELRELHIFTAGTNTQEQS